MTTPEIESLFARTAAGDYESKDAWDAVRTLRLNGSPEIFERANAWCRSDDPLKRARAAAILCQLQRGSPPKPEFLFRDESFVLLTNMLESEQDPTVLDSIIHGLGHLHNELAVPLIVGYQDHTVSNVRFAVTFALGSTPNNPQSMEALLRLTADPDDDIRDWAVFGLGVLGDADSPEIREALLRCLNDGNENVREEAAVGLGKRREKRLIPALQIMLDRDPPDWTAADYRAAILKIGE